ncbi:MAG: hypothetical protein QM743_06470 [Chitinophagaceae bacterium]
MKKLVLSVTACCFLLPASAQTFSRLTAMSLHTYDGTKFNFTDSTYYLYKSARRGGDLTTPYIAFDQSFTLGFDLTKGAYGNKSKMFQSFDALNHRTFAITTLWNSTITAWEDQSTSYYYPDALDSLTSQVDQQWNERYCYLGQYQSSDVFL